MSRQNPKPTFVLPPSVKIRCFVPWNFNSWSPTQVWPVSPAHAASASTSTSGAEP